MKITETEIKSKMYFYENFAGEFDSKMNMYDTLKRIDVIFNELLTEDINGKLLLDAGCGTGWFSQRAFERGAIVTSMDLGDNLLNETAKKCNSKRVIGSVLEIPFENNSFDIIISSEVIEHVPNPLVAIKEMYRVLKPGGTLILTTPNKIWYFAIWIANTFKLRPYQGLENWSWYYSLKNDITRIGFNIIDSKGTHLFPFIHKSFYPILNITQKFSSILAPVMLNIAVKAVK